MNLPWNVPIRESTIRYTTTKQAYKGLRKVCSESKRLGDNCYLQINLIRSENRLFTNHHCSIGQQSWTQYHDDGVLVIGNISKPKTMDAIRQMVKDAVAWADFVEANS